MLRVKVGLVVKMEYAARSALLQYYFCNFEKGICANEL